MSGITRLGLQQSVAGQFLILYINSIVSYGPVLRVNRCAAVVETELNLVRGNI